MWHVKITLLTYPRIHDCSKLLYLSNEASRDKYFEYVETVGW